MHPVCRRGITLLLAVWTACATVALAQAPVSPPASELERRLFELEQQLEQQRQEQAALREQLDAVLKARKEPEAKKKEESEPYEVGSELKMSASWKHGLEVQSAHKDFHVHVGGRTQFDAIWIEDDPQAFLGAGGIGDADSVNFRRARLRVEGTMYELIDWECEYEFLNTVNLNQGLEAPNQNNTAAAPAVTDAWIQIKELPVVGHLRIGNMKEPIGLEHNTSSRYLDFIERSYLQDAYTGPFNNGFTPGVMIWDTSENKRWHYDLGVFKNNSNIFGFGVGDGEYAIDARLVHLLWYDEPTEGRYLAHLGVAASHRDTDDDRIRIRSRGSLRNGPPGPLNPVLADTGTYIANDQDLIAFEGAVVWGAWLVQSEYITSFASDSFRLNGVPLGTTFSDGYYVQVLYFLTGEHRAYNHDRAGFSRVVPYDTFFLVRGMHGLCHGKGAWQIGARYNYLDLRDGGLDGGIIRDWTLGLNWFLNPNLKIQWNYVYTDRDAPGAIPGGDFHGFGTRLAYDF
jgi:phosphate-selective porin OprO/OprP